MPVHYAFFMTGNTPPRSFRSVVSTMNQHLVSKRLAQLLGHAGLAPFVLLALGCWVVQPEWFGAFIKAQLAYGVLIFAFLGGIHWGAALLSPSLDAAQTKKALGWGVSVQLLAWFATMIGGFGFALLMAGFVAEFLVDKRFYAWYGLPDWLLRLRFHLTTGVVVSLALTVAAANVRG